MRKTALACLALGLFLQTGCSMAPKMTALRKEKPNSQKASKYLTAEQFEKQGKFERAREVYQEMLDSDPKNPDYMHRLAVVCTRLQRYGEANSLYERAYKLDPKNPNLITDMGYSAYLRGDFAESERLLRESLHLNPNSKRTVSNLALAVGRGGKLGESLFLLRQVGDEKTALTGLAYIYSERGENELAEERYREALAIDPELKDAQRGLAELTKRKSRNDSVMTESTAIAANTPTVTTPPSAVAESAKVQQVQASEEFTTQGIETAQFVDEPKASSIPAMLSDEHEDALPESRNGRLQKFEETDVTFDDGAPATSEAAEIEQPSDENDWDGAEPATETKPAKTYSVVPSVFESSWDDASTNDQPTVTEMQEELPPAEATKAVPRLKFVATKSAEHQPQSKVVEKSRNQDEAWDSER